MKSCRDQKTKIVLALMILGCFLSFSFTLSLRFFSLLFLSSSMYHVLKCRLCFLLLRHHHLPILPYSLLTPSLFPSGFFLSLVPITKLLLELTLSTSCLLWSTEDHLPHFPPVKFVTSKSTFASIENSVLIFFFRISYCSHSYPHLFEDEGSRTENV